MEAGDDGFPSQLPVLPPLVPAVQHLDTIRALHQTVVALRVALEKSRGELQDLRQKVQTHIDTSVYVDTIERLSLENHILRHRVLNREGHEVPEYDSDGNVQGASPSPSAATYTLSPPPGNMDATAQGKNGSLELASPKDKSKDSSFNVTSPRATSTPADTSAKSPLAPGQNHSRERPEVPSTFKPTFADSGKLASANGIPMATAAMADANEGDESDEDQEPEAEQDAEGEAGGGGGQAGESEEEDAADSEELDDIELIFTTEETKELGVLQGDLVPIADAEEDGVWPAMQFASADGDDADSPTGKPPAPGIAPVQLPGVVDEQPPPSPSVSMGDRGSMVMDVSPDAPPAGGGHGAWARSVLIETDISKCGVVEEGAEMLGHLSRRNTLPAPLGFPPMVLLPPRDPAAAAMGVTLTGRSFAVKFSAAPPGSGGDGRRGEGGGEATGPAGAQRFPARPILVDRCRGPKRESEAQTDITALPAHWRSESALAQKVSHAFTTLPSKFALPEMSAAVGGGGGGGCGGFRAHGGGMGGGMGGAGGGRRVGLRLADKTQEARRALLSDINFTSMVPELSRSADHLCGEEAAGDAGGDVAQGAAFPGATGLLRQYPRAFSYMKNADFGHGVGGAAGSLVSPCGRYGCGGGGVGGGGGGGGSFARDGSKDGWSPCACTCTCACACSHSHCCRQSSWDSYSSVSGGFGGSSAGGVSAAGGRYRSSMSALEGAGKLRRHSWRAEARSCGALAGGGAPPRSWGSVPSSPTHHHHHPPPMGGRPPRGPSAAAGGSCSSGSMWPMGASGDSHGSVAAAMTPRGFAHAHSRGMRFAGSGAIATQAHPKVRKGVTFEEGVGGRRVQPGQSLPDLRSDWDPDSGDSTDSLIDEAEEYLRRSIDSILTGADVNRVGRRRQLRRFSEPDPIRELAPPQSAQPFLPKVPRDLKLDYFVKVITAEGRVMVGRVRYVGNVPGRSEPHVGVELPKASGDSNGSFQGRRFFDCDPDSALFVPFKKVVMAWSV